MIASLPDVAFLLFYGVACFTFGVVTSGYFVPWLVDRWHGS
jgi:hypothetical protein